MKIKCNDDKFREFIPSDTPISLYSSVSKFIINKAYCKQCKTTFTNEPTTKQIEIWRKHICNN